MITIFKNFNKGKYSIGKLLAKELKFNFLSFDNLLNEFALELNMSIPQLLNDLENNFYLKEKIENHFNNLRNGCNNIIVESNYVLFHTSNSFNIYIRNDSQIELKIFSFFFDDTKIPDNEKELYVKEKNNLIKEDKYLNLNDFENLNNTFFDLIIEYSNAKPKYLCPIIISDYNGRSKNLFKTKFLFNTQSIFPTQSIRSLDNTIEIHFETLQKHPIILVLYNNNFFIWDGHNRVSFALKNNISILPCIVLTKDEHLPIKGLKIFQFIQDSFNMSNVYDWEDFHNFKFNKYPNL